MISPPTALSSAFPADRGKYDRDNYSLVAWPLGALGPIGGWPYTRYVQNGPPRSEADHTARPSKGQEDRPVTVSIAHASAMPGDTGCDGELEGLNVVSDRSKLRSSLEAGEYPDARIRDDVLKSPRAAGKSRDSAVWCLAMLHYVVRELSYSTRDASRDSVPKS